MSDVVDKNGLYDIYAELNDVVGIDNMTKIYKFFKGQQVCFPQRMYKAEYVKKYIAENKDESVKSIARKFDYSERWIYNLKKSSD